MTEKKIFKDNPEIAKRVLEKFPDKKRKGMCKTEKRVFDNFRWRFALQLYEEIGKPEIQIK